MQEWHQQWWREHIENWCGGDPEQIRRMSIIEVLWCLTADDQYFEQACIDRVIRESGGTP